MQVVKSQSQIFITCGSPEEAENLRKALENIPTDTLDDILNAIPALKEEIGNLKKDNEFLLDKATSLQKELNAVNKENLQLKARLEKPLGKSKKAK